MSYVSLLGFSFSLTRVFSKNLVFYFEERVRQQMQRTMILFYFDDFFLFFFLSFLFLSLLVISILLCSYVRRPAIFLLLKLRRQFDDSNVFKLLLRTFCEFRPPDDPFEFIARGIEDEENVEDEVEEVFHTFEREESVVL